MQKWHCRICNVYREGNDLRRSKAKKTVLIMLCGMVEKGKIKVQDAQHLYELCVGSSNIRICKDHYCETASYISDTVASIYDGVVRNLFTIPGHIMGAIAARLESHRLGIDASSSLTAYDLATYHRTFRDEGVVPCAPNGDSDNYFELNPTSEDPMCTESTSTGQTGKQLPLSSASVGSNDILELDETNPELLDKHFLIKGSQLLKLFRFCPSCGTRISGSMRCVSLTTIGKAPVVHYICTACHPVEKRFEGLEKADSCVNGTSPGSNVQTATAGVKNTRCLNSRRRTGDVKQAVKSAPRSLVLRQTRDEDWADSSPKKRVKEEAPDLKLMADNCEMGPSLAPKQQQASVKHEDGTDRGVASTEAVSERSSLEDDVAAVSLPLYSCDVDSDKKVDRAYGDFLSTLSATSRGFLDGE